jgi:hypothetical protein
VLGDVQIRNLSDAWMHAGGNVVAVLIELYNWYSRYEHGSAAIVPTGLILSLVVVLILLFTGWKGREMVYRHRVGVTDQPAEQAARADDAREVRDCLFVDDRLVDDRRLGLSRLLDLRQVAAG